MIKSIYLLYSITSSLLSSNYNNYYLQHSFSTRIRYSILLIKTECNIQYIIDAEKRIVKQIAIAIYDGIRQLQEARFRFISVSG